MATQRQNRLLVCDLDNTLYNWVDYFVPSFYAMLEEVVRLTGCNRDELLDGFRQVHQHHHDSEHPFSLLEIGIIRERFPGNTRNELAKELDSAFHVFNSERKKKLKLHPSVRETLDELRSRNITLVAHTESKLYAAVDRLARLELTDYFSRIYCRERANSQHPDFESGKRWLDKIPLNKVIELTHHQQKPDPDVLVEICEAEGFATEESAYVGDSIARDILMAKRANVFSIWAKYGAQHEAGNYNKLVRVSHWTEEDVKRELQLNEQAKLVKPDFTAEHSFAEILEII